MFEKTIGSYNLIYTFSLPVGATLIKDAMNPADLEELTTTYLVDNSDMPNKVVVDGYIKCDGNFFISHKVGGAEEAILSTERYPLPVYNWHEYVYIRGSGGTATIRMLLSHK